MRYGRSTPSREKGAVIGSRGNEQMRMSSTSQSSRNAGASRLGRPHRLARKGFSKPSTWQTAHALRFGPACRVEGRSAALRFSCFSVLSFALRGLARRRTDRADGNEGSLHPETVLSKIRTAVRTLCVSRGMSVVICDHDPAARRARLRPNAGRRPVTVNGPLTWRLDHEG